MSSALVGTLVVRLTGEGSQYQKMLTRSTKSTRRSTTNIARSFRRMGSSVRRTLSRMSGDIRRFGISLSHLGRSIRGAGVGLTAATTIPLLGFGASSIKEFAVFERSLVKIEGLVGIAKDVVTGFGDEILKLSPKVGKGPIELANAMFFITSAGLRGKEALEALEFAAKGSALGMGETKVVADLLTSAMNSYGSANLNAAQATDILVATVREGKAEAEELAGAMGQVLPFAAALGVKFSEVGATVAAMTRSGTKATTAVIQLRQILAALLDPSKEARDQLKEFELSAAGIRKQLREKGLLSVLTTLKERFEGNDEAISNVFGNIRALAGVMNIMGKNTEKTRSIFENMIDNTGDLEKGFATLADTISFRWNVALARFQVLQVKVGIKLKEFLVPILEDLADLTQRVTQWWEELNPTIKQGAINFAILVASMGPLLIILGGVVSLSGTLLATLASLATGGGLFVATLTAGLVAIGAVHLPEIIRAMLNWEIKWGELGTKVKEFTETTFGVLGEWKENVKRIWEFIDKHWSKILTNIQKNFQDTLTNMLADLEVATFAFGEAFLLVVDFLSENLPSEMTKVFLNTLETVAKIAVPLMKAFGKRMAIAWVKGFLAFHPISALNRVLSAVTGFKINALDEEFLPDPFAVALKAERGKIEAADKLRQAAVGDGRPKNVRELGARLKGLGQEAFKQFKGPVFGPLQGVDPLQLKTGNALNDRSPAQKEADAASFQSMTDAFNAQNPWAQALLNARDTFDVPREDTLKKIEDTLIRMLEIEESKTLIELEAAGLTP